MVFQTWYSHFEYQVMLFGLFTAPANFHNYINKILAKKLDIFVIINLDNIFIYTKNPSPDHINVVWWILKKLRKHNLFVKLKKWEFHKNKVFFLEYVLSMWKVKMDDEKIKIVKNWPAPKFVRDIQVFLGFANFYQRFIQSFSKIAGPLNSIIRTLSPTGSSTILQSLINAANKDEVDGSESGDNETNLSNLFASKRSTAAG